MTADPHPLLPVWYMLHTYDFHLLVKYRYRIDIAIFWQYGIDIVSNSKNQYRCITIANYMYVPEPEPVFLIVGLISRIPGLLYGCFLCFSFFFLFFDQLSLFPSILVFLSKISYLSHNRLFLDFFLFFLLFQFHLKHFVFNSLNYMCQIKLTGSLPVRFEFSSANFLSYRIISYHIVSCSIEALKLSTLRKRLTFV